VNTTVNPSLSEPLAFDGVDARRIPGLSPEGVMRISHVFDRQIQSGRRPGAQLVVIRNGQVVLDRWGGYSDQMRKKKVTPRTPFLTFSITKPLTSMCVFKLIEEQRVDLDAMVADYWPKFGDNGKEAITIRHVLLHQAGLPRLGLVNQFLNISDWKKLTEYLANQKTKYSPGSKTAYHALNFGFILGEIVRRVTGCSIDDYLKKEFLIPLGLIDTSMRIKDLDNDTLARLSSGTLDHHVVAWLFNLPVVRRAVIPAASLHSTARDLGVYFQMLLNEGLYAGKRYLQSESIQLATSLGYEGYDESLRRTTRWGYGFQLGGDHILNPDLPDGMGKRCTVDTFGHYGQRTSMAWADKKTGIIVIFLCNRFLSSYNYKMRLSEISDAVWDSIA
jgi:CubicO group peptidase (beta-lactamase class C family)